jgi:hypothetical protein
MASHEQRVAILQDALTKIQGINSNDPIIAPILEAIQTISDEIVAIRKSMISLPVPTELKNLD